MTDYEPIRMAELVKIDDPDPEGGITLTFQDGKVLKIRIADGRLVSEFA